MRGPTKDQFIDYKALAIQYRTWANFFAIISAMELITILVLVFMK